ncbi:hypothetical protein [Bacillus sp. UNC438CL73TsuS30]|uniref:hypothetical protein n=1 Tax=Bacillus sp. UNC438CL73TsuS30 TaxID=1340434 RepID=UPI00047DFF78|nr:hypothetical protein [Bacillus sp. UNC438CL73TsuS30]
MTEFLPFFIAVGFAKTYSQGSPSIFGKVALDFCVFCSVDLTEQEAFLFWVINELAGGLKP